MYISDFIRHLLLSLLLIITPVVVWVLPVQDKIGRLDKNEQELDREIQSLSREISYLEEEKRVLEEGDPYYYERLIRSDLNMGKDSTSGSGP